MKNPQEDQKDDIKEYKTSLYQNETNYTIKLLIIEGKLQILIKSKKSFSDDIYEFANTYSFRQLTITNKYFSKFKDIEEVRKELDDLLKLKVIIEEEENDKTLKLKIPISMDKSSGDVIFKLIKTKKLRKVAHSKEKLKGQNQYFTKVYDANLKISKEEDNTQLLLGNINELVNRIKHLEKKEMEKEKKINQLKEDINNYQDKLNKNMSYPIYSPLANKINTNINLADDKNNNISQIIKQRNEEEDDDDDMNLDTEKKESVKKKKKKKEETSSDIKNEKKVKLKSKKRKLNNNSDDDDENSNESQKKNKKRNLSDSDEISEKESNNIQNGKEDSDEDKSNNIKLKSKNKKIIEKPKPVYELLASGFPIIEREDMKDYINSRIFYTIREMQLVKMRITRGKKKLHAYFDLLYRASVDGDYEETIKSLCEGKYPQITLFFTNEGARFGVYIDKEKTTSFFKKGPIYKEKPGTSFIFSLNTLKTFDIQSGELATDNRTEKLCFGRTYRYNNNNSNWMIYVPRNEFIGEDLKFGDKESSFGEIKTAEIIGITENYHLKDVEIFQVMLEQDGNDINQDKEEKEDNNSIIEEKENKKKKKKEKKKIENNDETISGEKFNEDNGKEEDIKIIKKKKNEKDINVISRINNDNADDDE